MPKKGGKRNKRRGPAGPSKGLRLCEDDGELFAVVAQMLGGPNCRVVCHDGKTRMCVIRAKFRWRNKNHNRLSVGAWVMVGVRGWETTASGEQRCDLLEVYSDGDAGRIEAASGVDLAALRRASGSARPGGGPSGDTERTAARTEVVFVDEVEADIDTAELRATTGGAVAATFGADDGEIDFDEI